MIQFERLNPRRNEHHWASVLGTLSLDLTQPHLAAMGIGEMPDGFVPELRGLITRYRAAELTGVPPGPKFAVDALALAGHLGGEEWARYLRDWGDEVFQAGGGRKDLFIWTSLLSPDPEMPPPLSRTPAFIIDVLRRRPPPATLSREVLKPRSEWDREVYERAGYDDLMNAGEFIVATIRTYSFWAAWDDALATGDQPAPEELLGWARERARHLHIPVDLVTPPSWGALPRPGMPSRERLSR